MSKEITKAAKELCKKFVNKVETGRARSRETYADCKSLLSLIENKPKTCVEAQKLIEDMIKQQWDSWGEDGETIVSVYQPELNSATNAVYLLLQRDGKI